MKSFFLFISILLFLTIIAVAQENPPVDNWCDAGGAWDDGRCNQGDEYQQDWHWTCGWYMAQVDKGTLTMDDLLEHVPLCESLFPPVFAPKPLPIVNPPPIILVSCTDPDDTDCDGLPDAWELSYFPDLSQKPTDDPDNDNCDNLCEYQLGTKPVEDTDADNITDLNEIALYFTDPNNPDSDGDALIDGDEVYIYGTDPNNPDSDNDGLTDALDNCPLDAGSVANNGCP